MRISAGWLQWHCQACLKHSSKRLVLLLNLHRRKVSSSRLQTSLSADGPLGSIRLEGSIGVVVSELILSAFSLSPCRRLRRRLLLLEIRALASFTSSSVFAFIIIFLASLSILTSSLCSSSNLSHVSGPLPPSSCFVFSPTCWIPLEKASKLHDSWDKMQHRRPKWNQKA